MLADLFGFTGPLTRAERREWARATTRADLAGLTARWLQGEFGGLPGYYSPVDVDEDSVPGMTATLIALNRAGFLTWDSQAGVDCSDDDGTHWIQYAFVSGFVDQRTYEWLNQGLVGSRVEVIASPIAKWIRYQRNGIYVTFMNGDGCTRVGQQLSRTVIEDEIFGGCSDAAINDVCSAIHVSIIGQEKGSNEMWIALAALAGAAVDVAERGGSSAL